MAERGASVVLCARNVEELRKVAERCKEISQADAFVVKLDVSDSEAMIATRARLQDIGSIDVLINSAGLACLNLSKILRCNQLKMFRVNVLGLIYVTQNCATND